MPDQGGPQVINPELAAAVQNVIAKSPHENIQPLVKALLASRLAYLADKSKSELQKLSEGQNKVVKLHRLLQMLNANKDRKNGDIDVSNNAELKALMEEAKTFGVVIKDGKTKFSKEELTELTDGIKMTTEDLTVKNDMMLQSTTKLTNETYESYQLARSILKPLHDDLLNKARAAAGR